MGIPVVGSCSRFVFVELGVRLDTCSCQPSLSAVPSWSAHIAAFVLLVQVRVSVPLLLADFDLS